MFGNSVDQTSSNWTGKGTRNIFVSISSKSDFSNPTNIFLTNYDNDSGVNIRTPHLTKINNNEFAVMWVEDTGKVKIQLINENGEKISELFSIDGYLSDCEPIVRNNNITWYVKLNNQMYLYEVNPSNLESITGVSLNKTDITLYEGNTESILATILPETNDADDKTLIWNTGDSSIATVDNNGTVTAVAVGNTTITVTTSNGKTASCNVVVEEKPLAYTNYEVANLNEKEMIIVPQKNQISSSLNNTNFPIMEKNYVVKVFEEDGVEERDNTKYIGSTNIVKIYNTSNKQVKEYIAIVKGDVNGDGKVAMYDAFTILKGTLFSKSTSLKEIDILIRDYNNDNEVKMYDAFAFLKEAIFNQ